MESLCGGVHHHCQPLSRRSLPVLSLKSPPSLFSPKPVPISHSNLSIKCSSSQNSRPVDSRRLLRPKILEEIVQSLLKPACITLATAAALVLSARFQKPSSFLSHAAVAFPSTPVSDTLHSTATDQEKERELEDRLESNPDDAEALQPLMEIKIKKQKLHDAIAIMDRLIRLQPDDKDLLLLKAHLYNHAGDAEAARAVFEDVLRKDPVTVQAYHGLVMLATQAEESGADGELDGVMKRIDAAVEACKKEKRGEELRDFMLLVAQVRVLEGDYDEALGVYRELVEEEPRDFRPYLCQGVIYTLLRKKDEADKQFEKYRRFVPKEHPYAQYFEENMALMKAFGQKQDNKGRGILRR